MNREAMIEVMARVVATVKAGGNEPDELDVYLSDGEMALDLLEAAGAVLVPREPTEAIVEAMCKVEARAS